MLICDVNVLVQAFAGHESHHADIANWLDEALAGSETIGLTWLTIWGFIRITSNRRLWPGNPPPIADLVAAAHAWLAHPKVVLVEPGPHHLDIPRANSEFDRSSGR